MKRIPYLLLALVLIASIFAQPVQAADVRFSRSSSKDFEALAASENARRLSRGSDYSESGLSLSWNQRGNIFGVLTATAEFFKSWSSFDIIVRANKSYVKLTVKTANTYNLSRPALFKNIRAIDELIIGNFVPNKEAQRTSLTVALWIGEDRQMIGQYESFKFDAYSAVHSDGSPVSEAFVASASTRGRNNQAVMDGEAISAFIDKTLYVFVDLTKEQAERYEAARRSVSLTLSAEPSRNIVSYTLSHKERPCPLLTVNKWIGSYGTTPASDERFSFELYTAINSDGTPKASSYVASAATRGVNNRAVFEGDFMCDLVGRDVYIFEKLSDEQAQRYKPRSSYILVRVNTYSENNKFDFYNDRQQRPEPTVTVSKWIDSQGNTPAWNENFKFDSYAEIQRDGTPKAGSYIASASTNGSNNRAVFEGKKMADHVGKNIYIFESLTSGQVEQYTPQNDYLLIRVNASSESNQFHFINQRKAPAPTLTINKWIDSYGTKPAWNENFRFDAYSAITSSGQPSSGSYLGSATTSGSNNQAVFNASVLKGYVGNTIYIFENMTSDQVRRYQARESYLRLTVNPNSADNHYDFYNLTQQETTLTVNLWIDSWGTRPNAGETFRFHAYGDINADGSPRSASYLGTATTNGSDNRAVISIPSGYIGRSIYVFEELSNSQDDVYIPGSYQYVWIDANSANNHIDFYNYYEPNTTVTLSAWIDSWGSKPDNDEDFTFKAYGRIDSDSQPWPNSLIETARTDGSSNKAIFNSNQLDSYVGRSIYIFPELNKNQEEEYLPRDSYLRVWVDADSGNNHCDFYLDTRSHTSVTVDVWVDRWGNAPSRSENFRFKAYGDINANGSPRSSTLIETVSTSANDKSVVFDSHKLSAYIGETIYIFPDLTRKQEQEYDTREDYLSVPVHRYASDNHYDFYLAGEEGDSEPKVTLEVWIDQRGTRPSSSSDSDFTFEAYGSVRSDGTPSENSYIGRASTRGSNHQAVFSASVMRDYVDETIYIFPELSDSQADEYRPEKAYYSLKVGRRAADNYLDIVIDHHGELEFNRKFTLDGVIKDGTATGLGMIHPARDSTWHNITPVDYQLATSEQGFTALLISGTKHVPVGTLNVRITEDALTVSTDLFETIEAEDHDTDLGILVNLAADPEELKGTNGRLSSDPSLQPYWSETSSFTQKLHDGSPAAAAIRRVLNRVERADEDERVLYLYVYTWCYPGEYEDARFFDSTKTAEYRLSSIDTSGVRREFEITSGQPVVLKDLLPGRYRLTNLDTHKSVTATIRPGKTIKKTVISQYED